MKISPFCPSFPFETEVNKKTPCYELTVLIAKSKLKECLIDIFFLPSLLHTVWAHSSLVSDCGVGTLK